MLSKGVYKARAVAGSASLGESKEKGTPFVGLTFEITDGPHKGETVNWQGWFSEKSKERTVESLMLCGWDGEDISDLAGVDRAEVQIVVEEEEYVAKDGTKKTAAKVAWVNDPNRGAFVQSEMAPEKAQSFAESMRGLVLSVKQKKGAFPPAPAGKAAGVKF